MTAIKIVKITFQKCEKIEKVIFIVQLKLVQQ